MKKFLVAAAIILSCVLTGVPRVSAQTAMFTYTGVPVGPVVPGSSFTIGINIVFTSGGIIGDLFGFSYWLYQETPFGGPFPFAITNRDLTGSLFTRTLPLVYPQRLDPGTDSDLGALIAKGLPGQPSGTYLVANMTFSVAPDSVPGSYTIRNHTSTTPGVGGRISVFNDSKGDTAPISASPFNITVVPEPSSIALLCVGLVSAGALAYRRRRGTSLPMT